MLCAKAASTVSWRSRHTVELSAAAEICTAAEVLDSLKNHRWMDAAIDVECAALAKLVGIEFKLSGRVGEALTTGIDFGCGTILHNGSNFGYKLRRGSIDPPG